MYLLFYAGMARGEAGTEQIGLARSPNGVTFERGGDGGLLIARDQGIPWRSLRTCNPTVLHLDGAFLMFYQGVGYDAGSGGLRTSIGLAQSENGVDWDCGRHPILASENMRGIVPEVLPADAVGLIEPSVVFEAGVFRMWFVYTNRTYPGNAIFLAESSDLREWAIRPRPLLSGNWFGDYDIHYPQVVRNGEVLELWCSLRNRGNGVFGVFKYLSYDGLQWSAMRQVLPWTGRGGIALPRRFGVPFLFPARRDDAKVVSVAKRAVNKAMRGWSRLSFCRPGEEKRALYGYAHPHIVEIGCQRAMYFHYVNSEYGLPFLDIGRADIDAHDRVKTMEPIFHRSRESGAWDEFFVGDPFVLAMSR